MAEEANCINHRLDTQALNTPPKQGNSIWRPWQPDGYVENSDDCYDGNKDARPGQTSFFGKDRGDGSFDYDCNDVAEKAQIVMGSCDNGTATEGWEGHVPEPGETGRWLVDCDRRLTGFPPRLKTIRETEPRVQKGR